MTDRFTVTKAGWYQLRGSFTMRQGEIVEQATELWQLRLDDEGEVVDAELKDFRLGAEWGATEPPAAAPTGPDATR